ncbi:MAG: LysE family translocator, partial [Anaerolineae bacterium]|nr:LysE family translocator [Anaerolineae bacterium]
MPDAATLLLFAAAAISINLTPGPDMLYVIARSIGLGRRAGIISALGLSIGYVMHTGLAASGLAALLLSAPAAYRAIRIAGAAYLVYLGLRSLLPQRQRPAPDPLAAAEEAVPPPPEDGRWPAIFRQGALTSTL